MEELQWKCKPKQAKPAKEGVTWLPRKQWLAFVKSHWQEIVALTHISAQSD